MSLVAPVTQIPSFVWDTSKARHLLERAGFGIPPSAIQRLAAMSPQEAVESLVSYERYPDPYPQLQDLPPVDDEQMARKKLSQLSAEERQRLLRERRQTEREAMVRLQMWWLERMRTTPRPLQEKMTLFWHGHFAVSAEKVRFARLLYDLNTVMRRYAVGNFGQLVRAVGKSPAMLAYLDNRTSRKDSPNENWARELFELFTLGEGHYTERDIKEAARAFTGWTSRGDQFVFVARNHDDGTKSIFGRVGRFDGDAVIDLVLQQPACAEFICKKLWTFFAYENPEEEIVKELSKTLRNSNYELAPVLRQMFLSQAFYSPKAVASQLKSPAQYVIQLTGQLGTELPPAPITVAAMRAMGQELFHPPNVKGWEGGRSWITTNTVFVRCSFARYLLTGEPPQGARLARAERIPRRPDEAGRNPETSTIMRDAGVASDDMTMSDSSIDAFLLALANPGLPREPRQSVSLPFDINKFFAPYENWKVEKLVSSLTAYFLPVGLSDNQRRVLLDLATESENKSGEKAGLVRDLSLSKRQALMYLLLSAAEYQLC